jgi:hypothetical protein
MGVAGVASFSRAGLSAAAALLLFLFLLSNNFSFDDALRRDDRGGRDAFFNSVVLNVNVFIEALVVLSRRRQAAGLGKRNRRVCRGPVVFAENVLAAGWHRKLLSLVEKPGQWSTVICIEG